MPKFETFKRGLLQIPAEPQVTILRRGILSLNKPAHSALGSPDAVELLYDPCERVVGLRPVDPREENSYIVRRPRSGGRGPFVITAMAFTKLYDIDTTQSLRRDAFLDNGVLCVCLNDAATPVTSNRARHTDIPQLDSPEQEGATGFDEMQSVP